MTFEVIPAIDLLDGQCVRLVHGDFERVTVYEQNASGLATRYAEQGARWLHVVDLAASRDGKEADITPLLKLLDAAPQSVQTGGGVRNAADIGVRLDHGADRVVVGSVSIEQPQRFAGWLRDFGSECLVAALDVRVDEDGMPWLKTHGWTRESGLSLWKVLDFYSETGLRHVLCTDIGKDGAMAGPNLELYREVARRYPDLSVQASGGVRDLDDLIALSGTGAASAISGKALLEGCFTVAEAVDRLS